MDLYTLTSEVGETLSLLLIFTSFAILTYLSARSKSFQSLQFQMFVVVFILVVAEGPRVLESLGLLVSNGIIDEIGLAIHTVSMIFLSGFLLYRVRSLVFSDYKKKKDEEAKEKKSSVSDGIGEIGIATSHQSEC